VSFTVYGAYGMTGSLVVKEAVRRGHRPRLAGRDPRKLAALAEPLGLEWDAVDLRDRAALEATLRRSPIVLHAAGPFAQTGRPVVDACLATGTSYVDTCGELDYLVELDGRRAAVDAAKVGVIVGAGFGVTAGDCLALHVARRLPGARWLDVAMAPQNASASPAVSLSVLEVLSRGGAAVHEGRVVRVRLADQTRVVEAGGRRMAFASAPLAESFAAARSTAIPNVTAYAPMSRATAVILRAMSPVVVGALGVRWIRDLAERRARGAGASGDAAVPSARSIVWAEARDDRGQSARSMLTAGEGFDFAARAAVLAVERLAASGHVGLGTPAAVFGPDHVLAIDGVQRTDLT
jgi:short subunit dehydrogenase-like uncharacterized protein